MTPERVPTVAAVALVLLTAGCLGAIGSETGAESAPDDGDELEDGAGEDLPDADALLESALEAETSVDTVQGVQTVTIEDGGETVSTTQDVWQRSPDEYRAEIVETDEPEQFDVIVTNATTTWLYDSDANEAVRADLDLEEAEREALNDAFAETFVTDMDASVAGTDTVADRDVYVLELEAAGEDALYDEATIWVDRETHYPIRQESTTTIGDETMTTTLAFEAVTFDEPIDDAVFEFEPPEDAEVRSMDDFTFERYESVDAADAAVPFDLPDPDVPAEYNLESAAVTENLAGWSATLQYAADTERTLTVTVAEETQDSVLELDREPLEIDGVDATIRDVTDTERAIEWEDDGLHYTVSGDLADDDLVAVAESIVE